MTYEEWEGAVPEEITGDSLWKVEAYRLGLFAADVSWYDATRLIADKRTVGLSGQLYRAMGSISANLAEGYSRGTGRDRARFYEYSLGSARESRDWYFKGRHVLGETATDHRLGLLTQIICLLLTMIPHQRGRILRDEFVLYEADPDQPEPTSNGRPLTDLLHNIPLP